jgi:hypothetical protein
MGPGGGFSPSGQWQQVVLLRDAFRVLCSRQTSQDLGSRSFLRVEIGQALFPFSSRCLGPKQFSLFLRTTAEACHLVATPPQTPADCSSSLVRYGVTGRSVPRKSGVGGEGGQPLAGLTHESCLARCQATERLLVRDSTVSVSFSRGVPTFSSLQISVGEKRGNREKLPHQPSPSSHSQRFLTPRLPTRPLSA